MIDKLKYKKIDWSKMPKVYIVKRFDENNPSNNNDKHRIAISAYDPENVKITIDGVLYTGHEARFEEDNFNRSIVSCNLTTGDYEVILDGVVSSYRKDGSLIESHPINPKSDLSDIAVAVD